MILSPLFDPVRSSLRVFTAILLTVLVLSPVDSCVAKEVTLAGKYSMQLPDGWTAPVQSKTELEGVGPGKAELWAGVFETDKPVGEVQADEIIGLNGKAGYKVIERGAVKHSSGSTAQLSRFQWGSDGKTIGGAAYSLRLAPKEVVMLVVQAPMESVKTVKNDIQAIFNSIKPATATGSTEDSWLTTPAEESKGDSKATGGKNSSMGSTAPTAATAPKTAGTRVTFATNCSVELPSGWTAKPSGKYLEGKGPGGAIVDGSSVRSAMSVEEALAQHLSVFEKMPGYDLVDTDEISTTAGAKGHLAYYHYKPTSGPTAEVGVVIKVSKNQIVTLRFLAPNAARKLDENFQSAVEAIFSSLKVTSGDLSAEKSTGNSKASGEDDSDHALQVLKLMQLAGKYVYQPKPANYILLKADGTFALNQDGATHTGSYTLNGTALAFQFSEDNIDTLQLEKNTIVDKHGGRWVKKL